MSREVNDTIDDLLKSLRWRVEELEAALRSIAEHPRADPEYVDHDRACYEDGLAYGHRCCAEIARKALEK